MPDTSAAQAGSAISISQAVKDAFPELLELILSSESMNDEERQYWIDILPVMTTDQIDQLKEILQNEREQLASIDAKYAEEMKKADAVRSVTEIGEERKSKRDVRATQEEQARSEEQSTADDILKSIE